MTGPRVVTVTMTQILQGVVDYRKLETNHGNSRACPGCGRDLMRTALTSLAYVFDVCSCRNPSYSHLVEQLWHRACLLKEPT